MPAIEVSDLRRVYHSYEKGEGLTGALSSMFRRKWKDIAAVDSVSFSIEEGEIVGFVGPNGSGKTTTMKMLSGILTPTSGECTVLGYKPHQRKRAYKKQIGYVSGNKYQLIWDLPPSDTFLFHRDLYEIDKKHWKENKDMLVDLLDVGHIIDTPARQLSLGERMKCELIVALLHDPKVLFLDEPTIGLDVISQKQLWDFLSSYQKSSGTTIMITSHYMNDIANLCPRVIAIKKGKIIFDGEYSRLVAINQLEKRVLLRFKEKLSPDGLRNFKKISANADTEKVDDQTFRLRIANDLFSELTEKLIRQYDMEYFQAEEVDPSEVMRTVFTKEEG